MNKYIALAVLFVFGALCAQAKTDCARVMSDPSQLNEQRDNINLPFKTDPQVIGYWKSVDFVSTPEKFTPGKRLFKDKLFMQEMIVQPNGKIAGEVSTWTKGHILDAVEETDETYEIRQIDGKTYLFRQWKSGDYTCRGLKPGYYVLEKVAKPETASSWPDNTNRPFVDDPAVIGQWKAVDFVTTPAEFMPGKKSFPEELYLKTLTFYKGGKMEHYPTISWTKGYVLHKGDQTASAYTTRNIGGKTYMFFEWKSGDYVLRGQKPEYYVLEKQK